MAFHPYLNFRDNCREAFTAYQEIFGGELVLFSASDMPEGAPRPDSDKDLVIHAALKLDGGLLMASDTGAENYGPVQWMYVNHNTTDLAEARRVFDALAEGGDVEMPFGETFFSPGFGVCKDRFGIPWMISTDPPEGANA